MDVLYDLPFSSPSPHKVRRTWQTRSRRQDPWHKATLWAHAVDLWPLMCVGLMKAGKRLHDEGIRGRARMIIKFKQAMTVSLIE